MGMGRKKPSFLSESGGQRNSEKGQSVRRNMPRDAEPCLSCEDTQVQLLCLRSKDCTTDLWLEIEMKQLVNKATGFPRVEKS